MIKIGQHIRINPLTVILFVICIFLKQQRIFCISYAVIFLHELSHFAAARALGLRAESISFQPFGVNLKLKNKIVPCLTDEVILYGTGPVFNVIFAAVLIPFNGVNDFLDYLYVCNLSLFFINIIPVLPLDGGIILKKTVANYLGYRAAEKTLKTVSAILIICLAGAEICSALKSGINISVIIMLAFLFGNIFTKTELYDVGFVEELIFFNNKALKNAKLWIMTGDDYRKMAEKFTKSRYAIVVRLDEDGRIEELLSEKQIVKRIMNN